MLKFLVIFGSPLAHLSQSNNRMKTKSKTSQRRATYEKKRNVWRNSGRGPLADNYKRPVPGYQHRGFSGEQLIVEQEILARREKRKKIITLDKILGKDTGEGKNG